MNGSVWVVSDERGPAHGLKPHGPVRPIHPGGGGNGRGRRRWRERRVEGQRGDRCEGGTGWLVSGGGPVEAGREWCYSEDWDGAWERQAGAALVDVLPA